MTHTASKAIEAARNAYRCNAWADATELFLRADSETGLEEQDLEALVWAAGITACDAEMMAALERLYALYEARDDHENCARTAFWCGLRNMMIGQVGLGSGWLQRARRRAEQTPPDCVQRGYIVLPQIFMH